MTDSSDRQHADEREPVLDAETVRDLDVDGDEADAVQGARNAYPLSGRPACNTK